MTRTRSLSVALLLTLLALLLATPAAVGRSAASAGTPASGLVNWSVIGAPS